MHWPQDFGAVGDGVADDSQAFLDAIAAIGRSGTILIPEGRYKITRQLNIPNRVILRGALPLRHAAVACSSCSCCACCWHGVARSLSSHTCAAPVAGTRAPPGEGPANTRLVFPKSLSEVFNTTARQTYGPGFIQFNGATWLGASTFLANVTKVRACGVVALLLRALHNLLPHRHARSAHMCAAGMHALRCRTCCAATRCCL